MGGGKEGGGRREGRGREEGGKGREREWEEGRNEW